MPAPGYTAELEQLAAVVERLPTGVLIVSKGTERLVFANTAARRLLHPVKLSPGAPLPEPWPGLSLRDYAHGLLESGMAVRARIEVDTKRVYMLSGFGARETNSGVILVEDISEGERRSKAEREFVANAAHELLTPLTGIVGAAHVLEAGAKEVPEDRDRFIAHIARECSRLTRIARSLLVLARAQSGEEPPRLEIMPLGELLDEAVEIAKSERTVELTNRCDTDITVLTDADLFAQALVNLLENAIRHGSGGEIVLESREIGSRKVRIDIVDVDAPQKATDLAAFQRRFHSGAGRDSGGFGLGLSIAAQSLDVVDADLVLVPGDNVVARVELPTGRVAG